MSRRCSPRSTRKGGVVAEDIEARLSRMRKAMAKMASEGREPEFEALSRAYEALKVERDQGEAERLRAAHVEARRVAAARASGEPQRWRLPYGFASPLAAKRAREGWRPREEPSVPAGGLSPWRRGSPASEVIWRPGR